MTCFLLPQELQKPIMIQPGCRIFLFNWNWNWPAGSILISMQARNNFPDCWKFLSRYLTPCLLSSDLPDRSVSGLWAVPFALRREDGHIRAKNWRFFAFETKKLIQKQKNDLKFHRRPSGTQKRKNHPLELLSRQGWRKRWLEARREGDNNHLDYQKYTLLRNNQSTEE